VEGFFYDRDFIHRRDGFGVSAGASSESNQRKFDEIANEGPTGLGGYASPERPIDGCPNECIEKRSDRYIRLKKFLKFFVQFISSGSINTLHSSRRGWLCGESSYKKYLHCFI